VAVPDALPVSRLSYSGLESYKRCGYRFYLERALKLRGGEDPDVEHDRAAAARGLAEQTTEAAPAGLPALVRGSLVHQLLEELDFASPVTPSSERVGELIAAQGRPVRDPDVDDLKAMVTSFADSPLRERIAAARRVQTELAFAFPLEPDGAGGRSLLINGIVDVYAAESDRLLIVDYKSDRLEGRDPAELTAEAYETQRIVYALAALRSGADRVEVAYCFLEAPEQPVSAVFGAADAAELEHRLLELAAGVVGARFEPTDHPHRELCAGCPGKAALCTWGPERTSAPA